MKKLGTDAYGAQFCYAYFLKLSFRDTLRLKTMCSGVESLLSRQK